MACAFYTAVTSISMQQKICVCALILFPQDSCVLWWGVILHLLKRNFLTSNSQTGLDYQIRTLLFCYIQVLFLLSCSDKVSKFVFLPQGLDTTTVLAQHMVEALNCKPITLFPYFKAPSAASIILVSKKWKVKLSRFRPGQALKASGGWGSQNF